MLNQDLIELIFSSANIIRWNDQASPVEFTELDKQAHKAFTIYILAKYEESKDKKIDWRLLIDGFIFEYFQRILLTDIKPQIFHKLYESKSKELNEFVLDSLTGVDEVFKENFIKYSKINPDKLEKKILKASHFISSKWEFDIIYNFNSKLFAVEEIKRELENKIEEFYDLSGVQRLMLGKNTKEFIDMIGHLRFQKRWSRTPRIPKTSVLGHTLTVAIFSYFLSKDFACNKRIYNNFFGSLFHDLPEVLTRDIISPIKYSIKGLDELIKECEIDLVKSRVLPLLPNSWHSEIEFFVYDEFSNKIVKDKKLLTIDSKKMKKYNKNRYNPIDGELLKVCDHLSAFVEAVSSIKHGVKSKDLIDASESLSKKYRGKKLLNIDLESLFKTQF